MTVHEIRLEAETPRGQAQEAVDEWVTNYVDWSGDVQAHGFVEFHVDDNPDKTRVARGLWRFVDEGETPTDILAHLHDRLENYQTELWFQAAYRVCDHDEDAQERDGDGLWDYRTGGSKPIPDDVPTLVPDAQEVIS